MTVQLLHDGAPLYERAAALDPETTLIETVPILAGAPRRRSPLRVLDGSRELVAYTPLPTKAWIPAPATAACRPPRSTPTRPYLNGLHRSSTATPPTSRSRTTPRPFARPLTARQQRPGACLRRGKFAEATYSAAIASPTRATRTRRRAVL